MVKKNTLWQDGLRLFASSLKVLQALFTLANAGHIRDCPDSAYQRQCCPQPRATFGTSPHHPEIKSQRRCPASRDSVDALHEQPNGSLSCASIVIKHSTEGALRSNHKGIQQSCILTGCLFCLPLHCAVIRHLLPVHQQPRGAHRNWSGAMRSSQRCAGSWLPLSFHGMSLV